ncbi:hypothetical protein SAMN05428949_7379 [Chitinophaga sp. YR627]|nr:hypothetical protein SAMN05428949_7379 [Chitinophaga sp. YR627]
MAPITTPELLSYTQRAIQAYFTCEGKVTHGLDLLCQGPKILLVFSPIFLTL